MGYKTKRNGSKPDGMGCTNDSKARGGNWLSRVPVEVKAEGMLMWERIRRNGNRQPETSPSLKKKKNLQGDLKTTDILAMHRPSQPQFGVRPRMPDTGGRQKRGACAPGSKAKSRGSPLVV